MATRIVLAFLAGGATAACWFLAFLPGLDAEMRKWFLSGGILLSIGAVAGLTIMAIEDE